MTPMHTHTATLHKFHTSFSFRVKLNVCLFSCLYLHEFGIGVIQRKRKLIKLHYFNQVILGNSEIATEYICRVTLPTLIVILVNLILYTVMGSN